MQMQRVCNYERMNVERIFARLLVIALGAFWILTASVGAASGLANTPLASVATAMLPVALLVIVFVVGLFYEKPAAWLLFAGAILTIAWGLVARWEPGVWGMMMALLAAPMLIAGLLYMLASRTQMVCQLQDEEGHGTSRPAAGHA